MSAGIVSVSRMSSDAAVEGVVGAASAMFACAATYPLMTICTQQAVRSKGAKVSEEDDKEDLSAYGTAVQITRSGGLKGLYRGIRPALLGTGASQGVYFYLYSLCRKAAENLQGGSALQGSAGSDIGIVASLLVASAAGCGNVLLTNPFWVLVTRMQTSKVQQHHTGARKVAKEIYQEGGILSFWKGVVPTLLMVANPTVQYMIYEWLRARLAESKAQGKLKAKSPNYTAGEVFVMSAIAKLGATVVTYPMQLVKSRLQATGEGSLATRKYRGTLDAVQKIFEAEGMPGFYHGFRAKIFQSVLAAALLFVVKEKLTAGVRTAMARPQRAVQ